MALLGSNFFAVYKNIYVFIQFTFLNMPCFSLNACSMIRRCVCTLNYNPQPLRHSWTSTRTNTDYAFLVFLMSSGAKCGTRAILSHTFFFINKILVILDNISVLSCFSEYLFKEYLLCIWMVNLNELSSYSKENWIEFGTLHPIKLFWLRTEPSSSI